MSTGLKYLCKTSGKTDPYLYKGSGVRWTNHIKKHNSYIITCIIGCYESKQELINAGLYYSHLYNVVQDKLWANLTEEKGDGGLIGTGQLGRRWKITDTSKMHNTKTKTEAWYKGKEKTKGKNNYQFKGIIRTPWGDFETGVDAVHKAKELRKLGNTEVITDRSSLQKYLQTLDTMLNLEGRRIPKNWRGKTPRELGFDFIKDTNVKN
jgi:hypothetical protein